MPDRPRLAAVPGRCTARTHRVERRSRGQAERGLGRPQCLTRRNITADVLQHRRQLLHGWSNRSRHRRSRDRTLYRARSQRAIRGPAVRRSVAKPVPLSWPV